MLRTHPASRADFQLASLLSMARIGRNDPCPCGSGKKYNRLRSSHVKAQMEAHWEEWYNEPVPALNNKTPLEAARTKAGRERLEALLVEFERRNEEVSQPHLRVDINAIREKLGL
jgi:SEC-C motif/Protein of unknown function (DUF2384)